MYLSECYKCCLLFVSKSILRIIFFLFTGHTRATWKPWVTWITRSKGEWLLVSITWFSWCYLKRSSCHLHKKLSVHFKRWGLPESKKEQVKAIASLKRFKWNGKCSTLWNLFTNIFGLMCFIKIVRTKRYFIN